MKWIIMIVAVEAVVEILMHSELFARLRRIGRPMDCPWCLSVWVAAGAYTMMMVGVGWALIPLAVHRLANIFHELYSRLRDNHFREEE